MASKGIIYWILSVSGWNIGYCLFQAGISRDKVIPLYGRGGEGKDPREKVPPRPQVGLFIFDPGFTTSFIFNN